MATKNRIPFFPSFPSLLKFRKYAKKVYRFDGNFLFYFIRLIR